MNSLVYNTVKEPTSTVVVKWSRKGKVSIPDETVLLSAFPQYTPSVLSFITKQSKAILQFDTVEIAVQFTNQCDCGEIVYNNVLRFHPSYCSLVQPNAKKTNSQAITHIDFPDVEQKELKQPLSLSASKQEVLNQINNLYSTNYNILLTFSLTPGVPLSIFLEHHLYGDTYAMIAVCEEEGNWKVTIPHEMGMNVYQCTHTCFHIQEKTRFCRNLLTTSEKSGRVFIATTKRTTPCSCSFHDFCHDRLVAASVISKPTQMENEHVYEVYDKIAGHFSSTRYSQWTGVVDFLASLPNYSIVLDMGCGNGKYLTYSQDNHRLYLVGCDRSVELLRICAANGKDVSLMDGLFMTYRDGCFDSVISIAVIHHLSTNALRRRFVDNLLRVLKKGGRALIVAWAMEKDGSGLDTKSNRGYAKADVMVQWQLQKKFDKENQEKVYQRYYHMFHQGELEWLLSTFDCVEIEKSWYERENWFVIIKKV